MHVLLPLLTCCSAAMTQAAKKRALVWIYGSEIFPAGSKLETTLAKLAQHVDSFNAVAPQMYTVGCASGKAGCVPDMVSGSSDPGITPDPALATRFHALGSHIEYWPTFSSPDYWKENETAAMKLLLAHPETVIATAVREAKRWNITGYQLDMEAPSPYGDDAVAVVEFVNTFATAMHSNGVQVSYCIGGMNGNQRLAAALNRSIDRTVPMNLYGSFDDAWRAEVGYWKEQGMIGKVGVGFCPTCGTESASQIAGKFKAAEAMGAQEIDMFAFGGSEESAFVPYWAAMKSFLHGADTFMDEQIQV